jgi:uncharacterized protein
MRKSEDIVVVELEEKVILFSTISKTIIELSKVEYHDFESENFENSKFISRETINFLKDNYFVLEKNTSNKLLKKYLLEKDRLDPYTFTSYIAFSTLCNFSCVYCFEGEQARVNKTKIMDEKTLNGVLEWYEFIIQKNNYKCCKVILFGGEPLIHKNLIKEFLLKLKKIANKNGSKLITNIITNGFLLDNEIVSFLCKYELDEIQITLDGVGDVHNRRRPLKNGGPTFENIINNIKKIEKFKGRFLIRISFDNNNIQEVEELLEYLSNLKINNIIDIYFAPIHQISEQQYNPCSFCSKNIYNDQIELLAIYKKLYSKAKNYGFSIPEYYSNGPCMTVANDSALVSPDGTLYKCVEMIGISELNIGNVYNKSYNGKYYEFVSDSAYYKCIEKNCKYLLLCGGGCVMQTYLKGKKLNDINCELELFEGLNKYLLELNYGGMHDE